MISSIVAFVVAAVLEIGGCFAFWLWLKRGQSPVLAAIGVVSLCGFAFALTRVDSTSPAAYAAYGGIYIAASLSWLWIVERQRPTHSDLFGAGLAIVGAVIIIAFRGRTP